MRRTRGPVLKKGLRWSLAYIDVDINIQFVSKVAAWYLIFFISWIAYDVNMKWGVLVHNIFASASFEERRTIKDKIRSGQYQGADHKRKSGRQWCWSKIASRNHFDDYFLKLRYQEVWGIGFFTNDSEPPVPNSFTSFWKSDCDRRTESL